MQRDFTPIARFERLRAEGRDSAPIQNAIAALCKVAGRCGESPMRFWQRWGGLLWSNDIAHRSGVEVVAWMERQLLTRPLHASEIPSALATIPAADARAAERRMLDFERDRRAFDCKMQRTEEMARDVENMRGDEAVIEQSRAIIGAMLRQVSRAWAELEAEHAGLLAAELAALARPRRKNKARRRAA